MYQKVEKLIFCKTYNKMWVVDGITVKSVDLITLVAVGFAKKEGCISTRKLICMTASDDNEADLELFMSGLNCFIQDRDRWKFTGVSKEICGGCPAFGKCGAKERVG